MTEIKLDEVVFDREIYPRAEWSQATVNRYAEAIEAGDQFPPIVLERATNRLLDGLHRLKAHSQALRTTIEAVFVDVPDGVPPKLYAASFSVKHGDRIKGDELRLIAREVFEANPDYDIKTAAKLCAVTRQTMAKWVGDIQEHRRAVRQMKAVLLKRAGWSLKQIGELLGISFQQVSNDVKGDITGIDEGLLREAADGLPESVDVEAIVEGLRQERIFASWSDEERELLAKLRKGLTVVVSMRENRHANLISWADEAGLYVRIDRRTEWGNPFEVDVDGDRETVINYYDDLYMPYKRGLQAKLESLRGKALGCWCAPEPCHGDVLVELAEQVQD